LIITTAAEPSTTTYKLLFVHDKRSKKGPNDLRAIARDGSWLTTWTETTVEEGRWNNLKDSPGANGFITLNPSGKLPKLKGKVNVVVDEWVSRHIHMIR
jgi:hypothetical protein